MSLLKRIEQGQSGSSSSPQQPAAGAGGGAPSGGAGGDSSRLSSLQTRRTNAPITAPQAGTYFDLKTRVQNRLLAELDPSMDISRLEEVRKTIQDLFEQILSEENIVLSRPERARLFEQIAAELETMEKTIKVHRGRVMEKMGVRSLAELVRLAQRLGVEARGRRSTASV